MCDRSTVYSSLPVSQRDEYSDECDEDLHGSICACCQDIFNLFELFVNQRQGEHLLSSTPPHAASVTATEWPSGREGSAKQSAVSVFSRHAPHNSKGDQVHRRRAYLVRINSYGIMIDLADRLWLRSSSCIRDLARPS